MKVFVTGCTGFVGRHIVKELLLKGFTVYAGVRDTAKATTIFGDPVVPISVDFSDKNSIKKALFSAQPEYIVHLIGIISEAPSKGMTFEKVHWQIPRDLYNAAKDTGVRKIAHMSALGVHPEAPSRYHKSKLKAEQEVHDSGIPYTIFRPSVIIGPEQKLFTDMKKATNIFPVMGLPEGGKHMMQPVDVRDVACSFVSSLLDNRTDKTFELCGPDVITFRQLLQEIFSIWNKKVLLMSVPKKIISVAGKIAEGVMDNPPVTSDLVLMMWKNNVCGLYGGAESDGVKALCGTDPRPFSEALKWSLQRDRNA
jgi:uncharacterized protein YbjT (DUF2867 family)